MLFIQVWNHGLGVNGESLTHALRAACTNIDDWPELKEKGGLSIRAVLDGPPDDGFVYIVVKYWSNNHDINQICRVLQEVAEKFFAEIIKRPRDVIVLPENGAGIWA